VSDVSDFEITALVLAEHEVFRREFSALEDLSGQELAAAWEALHAKLEVHAVAEEQLFYPLLAREADGEQETAEGVHDHNEIRHAAATVAEHEVGSEAWWDAVRTARQVNADHMAEEETDFFPPFKEAVDGEQHEALGMRWLSTTSTSGPRGCPARTRRWPRWSRPRCRRATRPSKHAGLPPGGRPSGRTSGRGPGGCWSVRPSSSQWPTTRATASRPSADRRRGVSRGFES
jgi:hypothetical protein